MVMDGLGIGQSEVESMSDVDQAIDFLLNPESRGFGIDDETVKKVKDAEQLILRRGREILPYLREKMLDTRSGEYLYSRYVSDLATTEDVDLIIESLLDPRIKDINDRSAVRTIISKIDALVLEARLEADEEFLEKIGQDLIEQYEAFNQSNQSEILQIIALADTDRGREFVSQHLPTDNEYLKDEVEERAHYPKRVRLYSDTEFQSWEDLLEERKLWQNSPDPYEDDDLFGGEDDYGSEEDEDSFGMSQANSDLEIRDMLRRLTAVFGNDRETREANTGYKFFQFEQERDELYRYSEALTRYLHDSDIADLVIIDRSSRPVYVGVLECWKALYPDEKRPGIFFLNPKGFQATADMTSDELGQKVIECLVKDDHVNMPEKPRGNAEIDEEFAKVYSKLMKDKSRPILVFDSCIHSGNSLSPVQESMERLGFDDVRIGAINPADSHSIVKTDFYITRERPEKGCYPFDRDRLIEKTFDHVYSSKTDDRMKARAARALRVEIRGIIKDKLAEHKNLQSGEGN